MFRSPYSLKNPTWVLAGLLLLIPPDLYAETADLMQKQKVLTTAITEQTQAQEALDQWNQKKSLMVEDIRDLEARRAWTSFQVEKHKRYVAVEKDSIRKLEEKIEAIEAIRYKLEPWIDELYIRLENEINANLSFLAAERQARLVSLRKTLDDPHLNLGEKLRHALEVVQIEASYSSLIESREISLEINGEQKEVSVLQLGRLAIFYRSGDGSLIGRYNHDSGTWEALAPEYERAIRKAIEVAENKRVVELLDLPVGRISK